MSNSASNRFLFPIDVILGACFKTKRITVQRLLHTFFLRLRKRWNREHRAIKNIKFALNLIFYHTFLWKILTDDDWKFKKKKKNAPCKMHFDLWSVILNGII